MPVGETVDYRKVNNWISACKTKHGERCNSIDKSGGEIPDFTVIDCVARTLVHVQSDKETYVALSYVWGSPASASASFPSNIPKTIEDAITVTKELGYR